MNRNLANAVVDFLSQPTPGHACALRPFSARQWRGSMHWLITGGLALYLLNELKAVSRIDVLPVTVRVTLERMWAASEIRVRSLDATLQDINHRFSAIGVPYANWKGFATAPDFCPDVRFRAFQDFDFFVGEEHLPAFEAVLRELGYTEVSRVDDEVGYENLPGTHTPVEKTYDAVSSHRVELHIRMNGAVGSRAFPIGTELLANVTKTMVRGIPFPVLAPADAFFLHSIHALRHFVGGWARLAWFLEIRHFIGVHRKNPAIWRDVRARAEAMPEGSVFVGIAAWLASCLFDFDTAECLDWAVQSLDDRIVAWLQRYGREAALADFPGTKLPLMLVRQFVGPSNWSEFERRILAPIKIPPRLSRAQDPSLRQRAIATKWQMKLTWTRLRFHARESTRYIIEKRRWERVLATLATQQTSLIS